LCCVEKHISTTPLRAVVHIIRKIMLCTRREPPTSRRAARRTSQTIGTNICNGQQLVPFDFMCMRSPLHTKWVQEKGSLSPLDCYYKTRRTMNYMCAGLYFLCVALMRSGSHISLFVFHLRPLIRVLATRFFPDRFHQHNNSFSTRHEICKFTRF
jgi:hypothetical protein